MISKFFLIADEFISEKQLDCSAEQLCIELLEKTEIIKRFHKEVVMKRDIEKLQKRKLFINWYVERFQKEKNMDELLNDLSDLLFLSKRTIQLDLSEHS